MVRIAFRAVEGDSAGPLRARWQARLEARPDDRGAALGLATLDRLSYDYAAADRRYQSLAGDCASIDRCVYAGAEACPGLPPRATRCATWRATPLRPSCESVGRPARRTSSARRSNVTQWRIGDRSTVRLVDEFYAAMAAGRPVADALRAAKLAAIRRGEPARDWAAFTAAGDPEARVALTRPAPGPSLLWVGAAGVALVLGGLLVRRRGRGAGETSAKG